MDKTIENTFFEAFKLSGLFNACSAWIAEKYGIGYKETHKIDTYMQQIWQQEIAKEWEAYLKKYEGIVIPPPLMLTPESSLMKEIANNIDECRDDKQKELYIYSLLKPFKEYSDIFHPEAVIEEYVKEIECDTAEKYYEIFLSCNLSDEEKEGTPEYCFCRLAIFVKHYAIALDVLLLERGINLLYYQQQAGILLIKNRDISALDLWLGGDKLTQKYIDEAYPKHKKALNKSAGTDVPPSEENTLKTQKKALPEELATPEAKVYFDKAIELKAMDENYNWLLGKELCSCFCREMSHKLGLSNKKTADGKVYVSWKPFELLFGYKNLRGDLNDIEKRGYEPKGIEKINEIFGL